MVRQLNQSEKEMSRLRDAEKRLREDIHDLLRSLYMTFKIEEMTLKNARSLLEIANEKLRPANFEDMQH
jgi:hypothetical protein